MTDEYLQNCLGWMMKDKNNSEEQQAEHEYLMELIEEELAERKKTNSQVWGFKVGQPKTKYPKG